MRPVGHRWPRTIVCFCTKTASNFPSCQREYKTLCHRQAYLALLANGYTVKGRPISNPSRPRSFADITTHLSLTVHATSTNESRATLAALIMVSIILCKALLIVAALICMSEAHATTHWKIMTGATTGVGYFCWRGAWEASRAWNQCASTRSSVPCILAVATTGVAHGLAVSTGYWVVQGLGEAEGLISRRSSRTLREN